MHNDVQQFKRSLKVKLGPNTLPGRQLDLRLCSLIFLLPLVSVYKCCFTVPRSEITLIGFTVTWNKAIARKLKACWGFWAQSQLVGEYLSAGLLPCPLEEAAQLAPQAGRFVGSVVGVGRGQSGKGSKSETQKKGSDLA